MKKTRRPVRRLRRPADLAALRKASRLGYLWCPKGHAPALLGVWAEGCISRGRPCVIVRPAEGRRVWLELLVGGRLPPRTHDAVLGVLRPAGLPDRYGYTLAFGERWYNALVRPERADGLALALLFITLIDLNREGDNHGSF
jgi:hypothetical protein